MKNRVLAALFLATAMTACTDGPLATTDDPVFSIREQYLANCAGHSPICQFELVADDGELVGKVTVNTTNAQLPGYVLVARGLKPDTKYTFGYTVSEEVYPIGTKDSPKAGALTIRGTFPLDDVETLQSAHFWVMETPPTATNTLINGLSLGNYYGWFITKIACYYSTDGGITWTESSHTDGIKKGDSANVLLGDLGVPDGALVRIHAVVVGGKDRTGSEVFQYSIWNCGRDWSTRYAIYHIDGVTWNPVLTFGHLQDINWG